MTNIEIARFCLQRPVAVGDPFGAKAVSAAAFGYGPNPANRLLAAYILKYVTRLNIPLWVIQAPVLEALDALLGERETLRHLGLDHLLWHEVEDFTRVLIPVKWGRRGEGGYVDTLDVNLATVSALRDHGLDEVVLEVAHFRHLQRFHLIFDLLGVEGVIPTGLDDFSCWVGPWDSGQIITLPCTWFPLTAVAGPRDVTRMEQLALIEKGAV